MSLKIIYSTKLKKDIKKIQHNKFLLEAFNNVTLLLSKWNSLPSNCYDHKLTWNYNKYRECHITPDFLLIYRVEEDKLTLYLLRAWSHSELF